MAVCVGIEVSPAGYRVVELDSSLRLDRGALETRVVRFACLPWTGSETEGALTTLRGRQASVVLWTRTDYRTVAVEEGSFARMLIAARTAARAESASSTLRTAQVVFGRVDLQTERTLADIAPTGMDEADGRRAMLLASAPAEEVESRLRPLVEAGVRIRSVLTPAAALQALARARRSQTAPGTLEVYVALEASAACMALVQDGMLLAAGDLPWGFLDATGLDNLAVRLGWELSGFAATWCPAGRSVAQVCLCGGAPELRSLAMALMQEIDVEVEPLDALFSIDAGRLPAPAAEFREQIAQLRLAWAAAGDDSPGIDLFRERRAKTKAAVRPYAAVAAGAAAGVLLGWQVQTRWPPVASASARLRVPSPVAARPLEPGASTLARRTLPPARNPGSADLPKIFEPAAHLTAVSERVPPPARETLLPHVSPELRVSEALRVPPPALEEARVSPEPRAIEALAVPPPAREEPRVSPKLRASDEPRARAAPLQPAEEIAIPFDAVLETILWSPDRALAIVDGRIVQSGDEIKGARIQRITETAVLLRDDRGRLWRLSLAGRR